MRMGRESSLGHTIYQFSFVADTAFPSFDF